MTNTGNAHRRHRPRRTGPLAGLRSAAMAGAVLAALSPGLAAASVVCSDDILPADQAKAVRVLQSELMVAALACGARTHYGKFVERYKPDLAVNGKALRSHFHTVHGQQRGFAELNRFVTRLANKASGRMASLGADFCTIALQTYDDLLSKDGVELGGFSVSYANRIVESEHGSQAACGPDRVAIAPNN